MSDYSNTFNGAAKDAANSTIQGVDFDTEFDNVETMSATKANKKVPAATGDFATLDAQGDLADSGKTPPTGEVVGTSDTQTLTGKTINGDNNTISNLAHGAEVDSPSSGVHGVTGSVVGTSDTQTLTNKTLTSPDINTPDIDGGTLAGVTIDGNITANAVVITPTELGYIGTLTSDAQSQIDALNVAGLVEQRDITGGGTFDFTGLDAATQGGYKFVFSFNDANYTSTFIAMYANADYTASNYQAHLIKNSDAPLNYYNQGSIFYCEGDASSYISGEIVIPTPSYSGVSHRITAYSQGGSASSSGSGTSYQQRMQWTKGNSDASNITSLRLVFPAISNGTVSLFKL